MARRGGLLLTAAVAAPAIRAGVAAARYTARVAAARRRGAVLEPDVPVPSPSIGLAAAVALDTLLVLPMPLLSSMGSPAHYRRSSAELDEAVRYYHDAGWLDDPRRRHPAPTQCPDLAPSGGRRAGLEVLSFDSGWTPQDGEPGADRWRSLEANATVPVTLLRQAGGPRPWLIAVHGQGMGRSSDVRMLHARRLHHELGVNVALPVLPLHGPRAAGFAPDRQFVSNVYPINNVLGLSQSVWDLRRLILWLRDGQDATAVGVLGVSLGSYVCSLLSTLEQDLACLIAVVPPSDLAASLRAVEPVIPSRKRLHRHLHDERSNVVHQVVSPLAGPCLVPHARRYIVAGQVDRIAPPAGAVELWRHWDEAAVEWRPRGHLTTWQSAAYADIVATMLTDSGLAQGAS